MIQIITNGNKYQQLTTNITQLPPILQNYHKYNKIHTNIIKLHQSYNNVTKYNQMTIYISIITTSIT